MDFSELNLMPALLKALAQENYTEPTQIQARAIAPILKGLDLLGCAQTGTGKTAAFALPILQRLSAQGQTPGSRPPRRAIRALVLTPTRELALQIYESFCAYGRYVDLKAGVVFGGVSQKPQEDALRRGIDILVATPGRLDDLMNQGLISLRGVEILTLDEADRMLDMGFIHAVKKIVGNIPKDRQTLLFSATLPKEIVALADDMLRDPVQIFVSPETPAVEAIEQYVYFVDKDNKRRFLLYLLEDDAIASALVFTRTKHGADKVVRDLKKGGVKAEAIHGNKSQGARQLALSQFKSGAIRVLVATDLASRGLDIDELSHVINYDIPDVPETYIHRIGRTGRAGHGGIAISFCDIDERRSLNAIEKLAGKRLTRKNEPPQHDPTRQSAVPERREHAPGPGVQMRPDANRGLSGRSPSVRQPASRRPGQASHRGQRPGSPRPPKRES
jgi:ATP-dependent RNA helicase RhlE